MKLRPFAVALFALILIPIVALALTSQRAQLGITILVNVTPNPLGFNASHSASTDAIVAIAHLRGAPINVERAFEAQAVHFLPSGGAPLVAATQAAAEVEASIAPNPTATLLTTDAPGQTISLSAEAGVLTTFSCVYHVTVDTAVTSWQIKDGLSADMNDGTSSFPGGDIGENTYVGTPAPTASPFVVYATDGNTWATLGTTWSGAKTFCVDLTLNIPIATSQGTYSSNAIYTLYY